MRNRRASPVESGIAVVCSGSELQRAGHACTRFPHLLEVIHGGKEIDVIVRTMRGQRMAEQPGAFESKGVVARYHAPENSDVSGVFEYGGVAGFGDGGLAGLGDGFFKVSAFESFFTKFANASASASTSAGEREHQGLYFQFALLGCGFVNSREVMA